MTTEKTKTRASLVDVMKLFNQYTFKDLTAEEMALFSLESFGARALSALKQCSQIDAEEFNLDNAIFTDRVKGAIIYLKAINTPMTDKIYIVQKNGKARTSLGEGTKTRSIETLARVVDRNGITLGEVTVCVVIPQAIDDKLTLDGRVTLVDTLTMAELVA